MIKGNQLLGRAVIDMEAAERLGRIKEIIVQHDGERIAGFIVVRGETIVGTGGTRRMIPASALHAIGPDAITVRGSGMKGGLAQLENLPRMSDIIGRKMVTQSGRLLGLIDDMLINREDGRIVGFVVGEGLRNRLESILNPQRSRLHGYVRADADLQVGKELIVVPDDALIEGEPTTPESERKPPGSKTDEAASRRWEEGASAEVTRSRIWTRQTDISPPARSETAAEARLKSETARAGENTPTTAPDEEASAEVATPVITNEAVTTVQQDEPVKQPAL
jgi:uncharacterized protein YrrD